MEFKLIFAEFTELLVAAKPLPLSSSPSSPAPSKQSELSPSLPPAMPPAPPEENSV
jgi:hypothetical protein